jgi:hypothetical protein
MTGKNYYYLINSLPDAREISSEKLEEVRELIEINLHPKDLETFRFLLYRNDNKNLLKLLRKRDGIMPKSDVHFYAPAVFSFEDLDDMLIDAYSGDAPLPAYLQQFLEDERTAPRALRERENHLLNLYYEAGLEYAHDFIRSLFAFKRDLKNIVLALNARLHGFKITRVTVGDYDLAEALARSEKSDFGVAGTHAYVNEIHELLQLGKLVALEQLIDRLLIDHCSQLPRTESFSLDQILLYFLNLSLRHRWHLLSPEKGSAHLDALVEGILRDASNPMREAVTQ